MEEVKDASGAMGAGMDESSGSGGASSLGVGGSPQRVISGAAAAMPQYSIPGILHFLQHEWSRFEMERSQWEVEKAELQVSHFS